MERPTPGSTAVASTCGLSSACMKRATSGTSAAVMGASSTVIAAPCPCPARGPHLGVAWRSPSVRARSAPGAPDRPPRKYESHPGEGSGLAQMARRWHALLQAGHEQDGRVVRVVIPGGRRTAMMNRTAVNVCFHGIGEPAAGAGAGRGSATGSALTPSTRYPGRGRGPGPGVRISFDDGNASDIELALPRLEERGLRATFFVLAGRLDEPGSPQHKRCQPSLRSAGWASAPTVWNTGRGAGLAGRSAFRAGGRARPDLQRQRGCR